MPPPNALIPELAVTKLAVSLDFYLRVLNFELVYQRPEEAFALIQLGAAQIMLDEIGQGRTFTPENGSLEYPLGRGVNFQIRVPDIAPLAKAMASQKLSLFLPREDKWYRRDDKEIGNRQIGILDPDGYLLRFYQDLGERPHPSK